MQFPTIALLSFLFFACNFKIVQAQDFVFIDDNISDATMTLNIADEVTFPDIKVVLGRDIPFEEIQMVWKMV